MRIIGGHDYFDSALAYGVDSTVVFSRTRFDDAPILSYNNSGLTFPKESIDFEEERSIRSREITRQRTTYRFSPRTVWFAGKRYGCVHMTSYTINEWHRRNEEWFWSYSKLAEFLNSIDAKVAKSMRWLDQYSLTAESLKDHFEGQGSERETDWLIENKVCIAISHPSFASRHDEGWKRVTGWKINTDGLGAMGFAKRLDPFTAFQELSMWIGGVLPRSGNPMVQIKDEKTMLKKHGMDEWSFRKMPGG